MPDSLPAQVSAAWLIDRLQQPAPPLLLDATMAPLPGAAAAPHAGLGIAGAQLFDIDQRLSDALSPLPHTMPTPEHFQRELRRLGLSQHHPVVVYDRYGVYSSPRAWWMLQAMGHPAVAVLDGGLPAWIASGGALSALQPPTADGDFIARPQPARFCDADAVARALADGTPRVLDARSAARFAGREAEPRPGLRQGHMPGALNLPFVRVLDNGQLLPTDGLRATFAALGLEPEQPLIFSCGSGVTACVLALAATLAGYRQLCVYDGSWADWGRADSGRAVCSDAAAGVPPCS